MSYTSGDWTARLKYLVGEGFCCTDSDATALRMFVIGSPSPPSSPNPGPGPTQTQQPQEPCICDEAPAVPFFPLYNGTPASMQFASITDMSLNATSATLCEVVLVTDTSGKLALWSSIDSSGSAVIQIVLNGTVVASSSMSNYLFYGSAAPVSPGTNTVTLRAITTESLYIASARLMAVGSLT